MATSDEHWQLLINVLPKRLMILYCEQLEFGAVQKCAELLDLETCCKMSIYLQKSASIRSRTSLAKIVTSALQLTINIPGFLDYCPDSASDAQNFGVTNAIRTRRVVLYLYCLVFSFFRSDVSGVV